MTTFQQVENLLPRLTRAEKARLAVLVAGELSDGFPGIERTAGVCGGAACVGQTRIAVWMLEAARRAGLSDGQILATYPTLGAADLVNAWNYARARNEEIERELAHNEAA